MSSDNTIPAILSLIEHYGGIDGEHHKQWVIDQIVRIITGPRLRETLSGKFETIPSTYDAWVTAMKAGEDGPDTYDWDTGITP